jgi:hypothetical protein
MTSMSDQELAQTETLLRQRLAQLADRAPTAVRMPDEVTVVPINRPTGRGRRAGLIAAVAALIGAGGFTTYSFLGASNDGGAATPEEAVTTFVSAMEQEDVLGMIDVTLPEEVSALRAAIDSVSADAKRVGLLGDDFDTGRVQGIDVSVNDLGLDTNFLEGGLAVVTAKSGTISASFHPQNFSFGAKLRELVGNGDRVSTAEANLANLTSPVAVMTVERDGRWYVSVEYTLAEFIRQSNGWEVPGPVSRAPVGFDSPEAAATGFYDRLAALDLQSAIDTFAPGEDAMAWLAQSWMTDAQATMERARANGWSVAISGLTYEIIGEGAQLTMQPTTFSAQGTTSAGFGQESSDEYDPSKRTVLLAYDGSGHVIFPAGEQPPATIDGLTFTPGFPEADENFNFTTSNEDGTINQLDFPTEVAGEPQVFTIARADGCTTLTGSAATSMFGTELPLGATAVDGGYQLCGSGSQIIGGLALLVTGTGLELPAVSVVQSGGKWYVSPLGTILASATINLHDIADGSSLFDTGLAPFLFGGQTRGTLELNVKGQSVSSIDPGCLPALTNDGAIVTGVVADPPLEAVRTCANTVGFGSSESSSGSSEEPSPIVSPETTLAPAATTP